MSATGKPRIMTTTKTFITHGGASKVGKRIDAATTLVQEFTVPACVIVKHGNPCGCALAATPEEAYRKALAADPASAFGGVVALNRPLSRELAALVAEQFVEVLHAPGYGEGAVDLLRDKLRNLRLLSLCVGRIASRSDRSARNATRNRSKSGVARTRNNGAEDGTRDGTDRRVRARRRTG